MSETKDLANLNQDELKRIFSLQHPNLFAYKLFIWRFILPPICMVGILTNIVNVVVFSNKSLKNSIYKFMFVHSIADLAYLTISFFYFFVKYTLLNNYYSSETFLMNLYDLYAYTTLATILAMFMLIIEMLVSIKRLLIVSNINLTLKMKIKWIVLMCFALSLALNFQLPLGTSIVSAQSNQTTNSSQRYFIVYNWFGESNWYRYSFTLSSIVRGLIIPIVAFFVNVSMAIKFRSILRRKNLLKNQNSNQSINDFFEFFFFKIRKI